MVHSMVEIKSNIYFFFFFYFKFFHININYNLILLFYIIIEYGGSMPLYEFIHSFRESNNSTHPYIRSKATIDALEKLKQMKNELGESILKNKYIINI